MMRMKDRYDVGWFLYWKWKCRNYDILCYHLLPDVIWDMLMLLYYDDSYGYDEMMTLYIT